MDALLERVEYTVRQNRLIDSGDKILVALSGGPDSVALLHILLEISHSLDLKIAAAHLDHGIRANSRQDRDFCSKLCAALKVKLYSKRMNIKALAKREKKSLEEAGRDARYAYFESLSSKYGFTKIATGHTLDDSVETVLLNITRGAGLTGLSGIPKRRGKIIRPLLGLEKAELVRWLKSKKISYRVDSSNASLGFARNRLRNRVIPELIKINPGVKGNIARLSAIVREELEFSAALGVSAFEDILVKSDKAKIVLDLGKLVGYDTSLRKKVLEEAFKRLSGLSENLSFEAFSRALDIIDGPSGKKSHLARGVFIESSQGRVALFKDTFRPGYIDLNLSGTTLLPDEGICLRSSILKRGEIVGLKADKRIAHLDYGKMGSVAVRFWRKGDKIRPLGMKGTRLLSDIFIDQKIPEFERGRIPLVLADDKVAWIAGVMVSDDFKITDRTGKVLKIELCAP